MKSNSDVTITTKKQDQKLEVEFKIEAHDNYLITLEAPGQSNLVILRDLASQTRRKYLSRKI